MPKYKFHGMKPPGGWVYRQAESKLTIQGENWDDLVKKTVAHRTYMGYVPTDVATVSLEIERQICTRLGTDLCRSEGPDDPWKPQPSGAHMFDWDAIKAASKAYFEYFTSGMKLVDMEEAERRRKICAACPLNQPFSGCRACGINKLLNLTIPKERRFPDLHGCVACGCTLSAKVNMPTSVIVKSSEGRSVSYPVHCWVPELLPK